MNDTKIQKGHRRKIIETKWKQFVDTVRTDRLNRDHMEDGKLLFPDDDDIKIIRANS